MGGHLILHLSRLSTLHGAGNKDENKQRRNLDMQEYRERKTELLLHEPRGESLVRLFGKQL